MHVISILRTRFIDWILIRFTNVSSIIVNMVIYDNGEWGFLIKKSRNISQNNKSVRDIRNYFDFFCIFPDV